MGNVRLLAAVGAAVAIQLLVGCSTNSTAAPLNTLPDVSREVKRPALLYVSDPGANDVWIYSYPSLKRQGKITGLGYPLGLCVDAATQNVWVVVSSAEVVEFEHGSTKQLRRLKLGSPFAGVNACAVNPVNGDLAVTILNFADDPGALAVFENARGKPKYYQTKNAFEYFFVAYDGNGNAFVDCGDGKLAELASGSKKLEMVTPKNERVRLFGGVQTVGSTLAIGREQPAAIYRDDGGVITGKTTLEQACSVEQFLIDGNKLVTPNACTHDGRVSIYAYPAGGAPIGAASGFKKPFAVVISR